jgi:hypothetical protein
MMDALADFCTGLAVLQPASLGELSPWTKLATCPPAKLVEVLTVLTILVKVLQIAC